MLIKKGPNWSEQHQPQSQEKKNRSQMLKLHWRKVVTMRWSSFLPIIQTPDEATENVTHSIYTSVYVCVHVSNKGPTSCRLSQNIVICLFLLLISTRAPMQTYTETHKESHLYTSAAIQSLSEKEGTDASSGLVGGGHVHC